MNNHCRKCHGEGTITTKRPICLTCDDTGVADGSPERPKCLDCYCEDCTFAPCQCGDIHTVCDACNGTGEERIGFQYIDVTKTLYMVLLVPNFLLFGGGA